MDQGLIDLASFSSETVYAKIRGKGHDRNGACDSGQMEEQNIQHRHEK